jgi:hypothetical protein
VVKGTWNRGVARAFAVGMFCAAMALSAAPDRCGSGGGSRHRSAVPDRPRAPRLRTEPAERRSTWNDPGNGTFTSAHPVRLAIDGASHTPSDSRHVMSDRGHNAVGVAAPTASPTLGERNAQFWTRRNLLTDPVANFLADGLAPASLTQPAGSALRSHQAACSLTASNPCPTARSMAVRATVPSKRSPET